VVVARAATAAALLACTFILPLHAQAPDPAPATRPKVGLVLSGGGARGLAHIGVLKVMREQRVPVDFIVATSMGSIVGGAYASGQTPAQMEDLVRNADWAQIFSDRPPREDLSFRRKEDDLRFIGKGELGLKKEGIVLPRGALGSQNLEEFLRGVSRPANDAASLNDLPILFRAVATDLETGRQVVLDDVPLSVAMRASMSIPGAFAPAQVRGRLLGDGGLVRNLPVEWRARWAPTSSSR
jgi:NTE family protein